MGSITRHSKVHNWYFSPWLSKAINTLRIKLGHEPIKNYFGNRLGNTFSYVQTNESFGITKIPLEVTRRYDMKPLNYSSSNFPIAITLTKERIFDLCLLPVIKLPFINYSGKQFLYRFLSYCQGTNFAVTAVHTKEEMKLFDELIVAKHDLIFAGDSESPIFNIFAKIWSTYCQENNNIFYKTKEHLANYFNIIEDRKKYGNTVLLNIEISQYVRSATQDDIRCRRCLSVPAISRPAPLQVETIISMFNNRMIPASNQRLIQIAPITSSPSTSFSSVRLLAPNGINNLISSPPSKKRRRDTCKVCSRNDCGGRSKRVYCANKCGKCQNDDCTGRYVAGRNNANIPCENTL